MSVGGRSNLERRPPSATDDPSQGVSRHRSDQASWRPNEIAQAVVFPRVRRGRLCDRRRIRHRWRDEHSLTKGADMDLQAAIPMFARSRRWNRKPRRPYRRLNSGLAECRRLGCGRFVKFRHARAPLEYLGDVANREPTADSLVHCSPPPGGATRQISRATKVRSADPAAHGTRRAGNLLQSVRWLGSETRERGMSDERNQCCSSTQSIRSPLH
jgi:hypothetical protein